MLNCDQLWQLFSRGWTILLSTVIYDLDSRINATHSKCQTSLYSVQVSFRFYSPRCSEILVSPNICTQIRTWRFHRLGTEEVSNFFPVMWHITHISMAISANLGRDTDHNSTKLGCAHPLIGSPQKTLLLFGIQSYSGFLNPGLLNRSVPLTR